ncbi:hypothetical protein CEXT_212931 [Caerostris extrusa]|uniref:Uncharacterized protein n=1 Tax=Caerostris extrusa TaxID=172846 RepID=A0AAV4UDD7_CAEEX|nr:hypothetical protein CEXT_212931 [Caerostris extrusa]
MYILDFKQFHWNKLHGERSGNQNGHTMFPRRDIHLNIFTETLPVSFTDLLGTFGLRKICSIAAYYNPFTVIFYYVPQRKKGPIPQTLYTPLHSSTFY